MAKIDLKEVKDSDLMKDLVTHEETLRKSRFKVAGTVGLKDNAKSLRKKIAQIKTEMARRNSK
mgnify:FL=1